MSYFLKLEGFNGKSYNVRHVGELEVLSVSRFDKEVNFSKIPDEDTPKLLTACMNGQQFSAGKITTDTMEDVLGFEMRNVLVASYWTGETMENFTIRFEGKN